MAHCGAGYGAVSHIRTWHGLCWDPHGPYASMTKNLFCFFLIGEGLMNVQNTIKLFQYQPQCSAVAPQYLEGLEMSASCE